MVSMALFEVFARALADEKYAEALGGMLAEVARLREKGVERGEAITATLGYVEPEFAQLKSVLLRADAACRQVLGAALDLGKRLGSRNLGAYVAAAAVSQKMRGGAEYSRLDLGRVLADMELSPRALAMEHDAMAVGLVALTEGGALRLTPRAYGRLADDLPGRRLLVRAWGRHMGLEKAVREFATEREEFTRDELEGRFGAGDALDAVIAALKDEKALIEPRLGRYRRI